MRRFKIENEQLSCDVKYIEYGCDEESHVHDGIEIIYIVAGHGEHKMNDVSHRVRRGSLIIIDYECVHSVKIWETTKYYNILFRADFLKESLKAESSLKELLRLYGFELEKGFLCIDINDENDARRIEDIFFEILNEFIKKEFGYVGFIKNYIDNILNIAVRRAVSGTDGYEELPLADAINYITDNCTKPLKLGEVARMFNYDPRYFSSKLKKCYGLSFKQLLIQKRLNVVIFTLWETDESIDSVIARCGFTNKTYFYDVFEKAYGIKPKYVREYRKNYAKYLELKTMYKKLLN